MITVGRLMIKKLTDVTLIENATIKLF